MPLLDDPKREKFAQLIVEGLSPIQAARGAKYVDVHGHRSRMRLASPDVATRISEIRQEAARRATDLEPIINGMIMAAGEAARLKTAPAFTAARGLLVEATRLKREMAVSPPGASAIAKPPPPRDMTDDEWLAAFPPQTAEDKPIGNQP